MEVRRFFSSLNILTRHGDYMNDGANSLETVLSPANVNPKSFGKEFTNAVDASTAPTVKAKSQTWPFPAM